MKTYQVWLPSHIKVDCPMDYIEAISSYEARIIYVRKHGIGAKWLLDLCARALKPSERLSG